MTVYAKAALAMRNFLLDQATDYFGAAPILIAMAHTSEPPGADSAEAGTRLGSGAFDTDPFDDAADGEAVMLGDVTINFTSAGTLTYWRIKDAADAIDYLQGIFVRVIEADTNAATGAGLTALTFDDTSLYEVGDSVFGTNIATGTTVTDVSTPGTVLISLPTTGAVADGATIVIGDSRAYDQNVIWVPTLTVTLPMTLTLEELTLTIPSGN